MRRCLLPSKALIFTNHSFSPIFSTFAANLESSDSELSDDVNDIDRSLIVHDQNLLCRSLTPDSVTGLHVLDLIDRGALEPGPEIYNRLLKKCTQLKKLKEGRIVHDHFVKSKFKCDLYLLNSVINMFGKCGSLGDAQKVFDEMPLKDMVTWTALITSYSQNDCAEKAIWLFPEMLRLELRPNQFTFASILKACGATPTDANGRQIHAFCIKYGADLNVYVGSSLLDMYSRCGDMRAAHLVFDMLDSKNEVSWNAFIAGYARKGNGEEAMKEFWKMQRRSFKACILHTQVCLVLAQV